MQTRFIIFIPLIVLCLQFTSCGGVGPNKGTGEMWAVCVQGIDTVSVELPIHFYCKTPSKNTYQSIEVFCNTMLTYASWMFQGAGADISKLQITVMRQTKHSNVEIFFIDRELLPYYYYDMETGINYHVLDSLMDLYGTTMTVDQDQLTVPLSVPNWAK